MNKIEFVKTIDTDLLTGIKAGQGDRSFLNIWIVAVGERLFARSWGFAERSWYNTFLKDNLGQIKSDEHIFNIKAVIPTDFDEMIQPINEAYLKRYDFGTNAFYAKGLTEKEHVEKTMEFILLDQVQ